jgi:ribosome maturation factor RimP
MGWAQPIFFWRDSFYMICMTTNVTELLERTLPPLGYELVDWEGAPKGRLVRVFIDKPDGVTVEDCARVSNHLTRLFAVENVEFERLEVSSPGLDRPLRKASDFIRFAGEEAELRLANPIANAKKLKGVLRGCEAGAVVVETAKGAVTVPLAEIDRARLVPRIEWRKAR